MGSVSVIIPNYNHAPYLPRRIESVLDQTYRDFDLLLLDDCSPDSSRQVIERYLGDPRVRTAFNETNTGSTYRQWVKGLSLTSGDYVWIAESDDFADPTFLQRLVRELDEHPNVGIAGCDSFLVDENSVVKQRYFDDWPTEPAYAGYDLNAFKERIEMNGRKYARSFMSPWNTLPNASALLFRRSFLEAAGGPETDMKLCGDWLTYCKVLMRSDIIRIPEPLNYFRQHSVNVRSKTSMADFVAESFKVRAYIDRELGTQDAVDPPHVRDFYCFALLAGDRRPPYGRVAPRNLLKALRRAHRFGPKVFRRTLQILAVDQLALLSAKLGLRKS